MKNMLKKLTAFIAVATMSVGVCTTPVSADEMQNKSIDEAPIETYYICDALADTNINVPEIIEKVETLYENGEISREVANDMINIWSPSNSNTRDISATAQDFFIAAPVYAGQIITDVNALFFTYPDSIENVYKITPFMFDETDLNSQFIVNAGNAVPSLTNNNNNNNIHTENYIRRPQDTRRWRGVLIENNYNATSIYGNLYTIPIRLTLISNTNTEICGATAYRIFRDYITVEINGDLTLQQLTAYNYIGSLGDIDNDADVDTDDKQILTNYLLNTGTFANSMQYAAADVTEDGTVNLSDYSKLYNYVAGTHNHLR